MKKVICLALAALMSVCCLTACTQSDAGKAKAYNNIIAGLEYDDSNLPVLKVATSPDFAPMEFVDLSRKGSDQYVGFDIILSKYIAKELGMKLEIKPMSFDAAMTAVQTGIADLAISGYSWTPERAENYLITDYYVAGDNETEQVVITTPENADKFKTAADFYNVKVAAQGSSLQELMVKEQLPDAVLVQYVNLNDAVMALLTGKVEAIAVAYGNGEAFISANPGKIVFSGFEFVVDDLYKNNVILVNKNNSEMLAKVNAVLAKAMAADLYNGWYEACQLLSEIKTLDELGYDDDGNKITE